MLEHGRISKQQMMWLYASSLLGTSILFLPQMIASEAKQDSWLTALLGGVAGLLLVLIWTNLANRFPHQNLVEYTGLKLGPILGTLVLVPYVAYLLWVLFAMQRQLVDFFAISYTETPVQFTSLCVSVVVVYLVLHGLEVIARVNDLVFPVIVIGLVALIAFGFQQFSLAAFQPVLSQGIRPVLRPLLEHANFPYGNAVAFLMIFPYLRQPKDLRYAAVSGSVIGTIIIFSLMIFSLTTLGAQSMSRTVYPAHSGARTLSIAGFIAGLDGLVDIVWVVSNTIRIAVFTYAVVICLSQLFRMSSLKYLVIPIGALSTIGSLILFRSTTEQTLFNMTWVPRTAIFVTLFLPLLLLMLDMLHRKQPRKQPGSP